MRTADSVREGEVMVFCFREAELNWRQELTYQRAETSWKAALASAPYTLTLWAVSYTHLARDGRKPQT